MFGGEEGGEEESGKGFPEPGVDGPGVITIEIVSKAIHANGKSM